MMLYVCQNRIYSQSVNASCYCCPKMSFICLINIIIKIMVTSRVQTFARLFKVIKKERLKAAFLLSQQTWLVLEGEHGS